MGLLRFVTPQRDRITDIAVQLAYVAGLDRIPTPSSKSWEEDGLLRLERSIDESGNLYVPWPVDEHGERLLCTASLMERERPYHLPVELARGTLNRLRTRAEGWNAAGLVLPDELVLQMKSSQSTFVHAATSQGDPLAAAVSAEETIRESLEAMNLLSQEYASQVLASRHEESGTLTTLLAGNLGDGIMPSNAEPMFCAAFNSAVVPFRWKAVQVTPDTWAWTPLDKQLQWCRRNGMKVLGGPLLRLDSQCLPDWIVAAHSDFSALANAVRRYVIATVERYRGDVHLWHCSAGTNAPGILPLSDDQKVRLTVLCVETVRRLDPRTPVFVSFDQPWAEYMTSERTDLWPIHFADMLIRGDLGIAGIGLEINYGYWPGGTLPRDLLEISEHIDYWSLLGLPLIVQLAIPSSTEADAWACPDAGRPHSSAFSKVLSSACQKRLVERILPVLLAKRSIHAVVWNQVFDSIPHKYANAGVFDAVNRPKASLSSLIAIRRDHLQ
jgi:hypothetical protein